MNTIRKITQYRSRARAVGIALVLLAGTAAYPVVAQVRSANPSEPAGSVSPVPGRNGMMNGPGGTGGTGGMMSSTGGMMGQGCMGGSTVGNPGGMMGEVDRHFIEQMIPHHQAAIDMAALAGQQAQHPELKTLAATIQRVQTAEIAQMRAWYQQWYGSAVPSTPGSAAGGTMGMGMGMMGPGPGMGGDLSTLQNATDFDRAFIEAMIPHHQMALMMSNMVLTHGNKAELRTLAQSIITSQTAEIAQMRAWYQQWYGTQAP